MCGDCPYNVHTALAHIADREHCYRRKQTRKSRQQLGVDGGHCHEHRGPLQIGRILNTEVQQQLWISRGAWLDTGATTPRRSTILWPPKNIIDEKCISLEEVAHCDFGCNSAANKTE